DYVLTGGELPAMVVADAVVRLIPGALGDEMSNVDESFSTAEDGGLLEYAQYTRPAVFNGEGVPPVLVSGDHAKVDAWRRKNAIERTCRWRPDLIETARLTPEERAYAQEFLDASYSQSEE
ncbi:MAG: tRNA (guanosine(37)-N1)-methyltransferase TrmD, partial [Collinsella aerofaciens]